MPRIGLALEGGGARGAYHIGVYKAYLENGYKFDGFVGTSIGAINAAVFASGDFDIALRLWENISLDQLFDEEIAEILQFAPSKIDKNFPGNIKIALSKIFTDKGVDTTKIRKFITAYIDEEKIRHSGVDLGLVTYSRSDREAHEVFIEDIAKGKLIDYIMASASLPGFTAQMIGDKKFIDGGVYNNCPINMLIDKGYDEIIAVRTNSFGRFRKYDKNANVTLIKTNGDLAGTLAFSSENSASDIRQGYFDGLRAIDDLLGRNYYLKKTNLKGRVQKLMLLDPVKLPYLETFANRKISSNRLLLEQVIPELAKYLKLGKTFTYDEFLIAIFEFIAEKAKIDRYCVYKFDEFLKLIKDTKIPATEKSPLNKLITSHSEEKEELIEQLVDTLLRT